MQPDLVGRYPHDGLPPWLQQLGEVDGRVPHGPEEAPEVGVDGELGEAGQDRVEGVRLHVGDGAQFLLQGVEIGPVQDAGHLLQDIVVSGLEPDHKAVEVHESRGVGDVVEEGDEGPEDPEHPRGLDGVGAVPLLDDLHDEAGVHRPDLLLVPFVVGRELEGVDAEARLVRVQEGQLRGV